MPLLSMMVGGVVGLGVVVVAEVGAAVVVVMVTGMGPWAVEETALSSAFSSSW